MTLMISGLYDALREAGAADASARKAASYDNRFAKNESDLNLLKWMVGFNLAMTGAILAKMLV